MAGEVIEKTGNIEKAFKEGSALDELKDFEYRKNELADQKVKLEDNIKRMNERLKKSLDFFPISQDTLDDGELKMAIDFTDRELNRLERQYKSKVEKLNAEFGGQPFTREANIVDAIGELNSGLERFIAGRLETIISEADMADEDRDIMFARLYPKSTEGGSYGEQQVAAINKHYRDIDNAMNAQ